MASRVRVVLSDLDDTLFDHASTTRQALGALQSASPAFARWSLDELDRRHRELLERLHLEVLAGRLSIEQARLTRFGQLLEDAGAEGTAANATDAARSYRSAYEGAWCTVPGALDLVRAIRNAGLRLAIVTNNVVAEQRLKLARCGLTNYVDVLVTSEETGIAKPDPGIVQIALDRTGVKAADAVMLGDSWATDIAAALAANVRPVWLNRFGATRPDASVAELRSLEPTEQALDALLG